MRQLLFCSTLILTSLALSYSPIPGYVSGQDWVFFPDQYLRKYFLDCTTFKCNLDSKCFNVGDSSCDNPDCPTQPRCILNGQITCDRIKCSGKCVMVTQNVGTGGKGVAEPQCFPKDSYGNEIDNGGTDGNTGNGNGNGGDTGRVCPPPPQGPPGAPCPPKNTCQTCCKLNQKCTSESGICEPRPGDPGPVCCPPIIRCFDCPMTDPCKTTPCPYGQKCSVIFPPSCAPFSCCPAKAHCTTPTQLSDTGMQESDGYNR